MRRPLGGFIVDLFGQRRDPEKDERDAEAARHTKMMFGVILGKLESMMHTLDEILQKTSDQQGQIDSMASLLASIHDKLNAEAGLTPAQQTKVDAIFDQLDKNSSAIVKAINANDDDPNTPPVETPPVVTPAPVEPPLLPDPVIPAPVDFTTAPVQSAPGDNTRAG